MASNLKERCVLIRSGFGVAIAAIGFIALGQSSPAFAQAGTCTGNGKISKQIAKPMAAAQDAQKAKKWQEVLAKTREAESTPVSKTAWDQHWMHEFRGYAYSQLGQYPEATREYEAGLSSPCMNETARVGRYKTLVTMFYAMRNYPKVIDYANRALKTSSDPELKVTLGQAYYLTNDNKNALRIMNEVMASIEQRGQTPKEQTLHLIRAACDKVQDNACVTKVYEKLVVFYPKPEYWQNLLRSLRQGDTNDKQKINVLRLQLAVDVLKRPDEFTEMAQIALDEGLPAEAQSVLETAFEKKLFKDQRAIDLNNRLLTKAKSVVATEKAKLPQQDAAARATPTGDDDVKVGAAYLSYGDSAKAVEVLKRGITQGKLAHADEAGILLGIAYLRSDNKPEAKKAFNSVSASKQDPTMARIAKLWLLNT
jgi:tetratricopeptide (TPR) repeat protein